MARLQELVDDAAVVPHHVSAGKDIPLGTDTFVVRHGKIVAQPSPHTRANWTTTLADVLQSGKFNYRRSSRAHRVGEILHVQDVDALRTLDVLAQFADPLGCGPAGLDFASAHCRPGAIDGLCIDVRRKSGSDQECERRKQFAGYPVHGVTSLS
jgi:hypothetical protein